MRIAFPANNSQGILNLAERLRCEDIKKDCFLIDFENIFYLIKIFKNTNRFLLASFI